MLVLVRRTGEAIRIGDGILITVLQAQAGRVKLGVRAPVDVKVMRVELLGGEAVASGGPGNLAG